MTDSSVLPATVETPPAPEPDWLPRDLRKFCGDDYTVIPPCPVPHWVADMIRGGTDPASALREWQEDITIKRERPYSRALQDDRMRQWQAATRRLRELDEHNAIRETEQAEREAREAEEREARKRGYDALIRAQREREREEARRLAEEPNPYAGMTTAELLETGQPDPRADHVTWVQWCRARDKASAEDARRAAEETRRLKLAGLTPLEPGNWLDHFIWLRDQFGDRGFSTRDVCEHGYDDPGWIAPPGYECNPGDPDAGRLLGMAYQRVARKSFDGAWIEAGSVSRGVRRWRVTVKPDPS